MHTGTINILAQVFFCGPMVSFFLGQYVEVKVLQDTISVYLIL